MALNGGSLNSHAINASAAAVTIIGTGSGTLVSLEQTVANIGSGTLVSLEQTVNLLETGSGTMITLNQDVQTTASGTLVIFDQKVRDLSTPSHLTRTGWDLDVYIGGEQINKGTIIRNVDIEFSEGDSSLATIVLRGQAGAQDLDYYDGKEVIINGQAYSNSNNPTQTVDGNYRLFTGIVDITEIDLINEFITLRCINERRKLINQNLSATVKTIGTWNETIFGSYRDTAEELDQRVSTIPYSADFDPYNNFILTSWTPKATADITFAGSGIFTKEPQIQRANAARIVNKITLKMQYRYQRLHHWQRSFSWIGDIEDNPCRILAGGYDLTRRDLIAQAVQNAGWPLRGSIAFEDPPAAGWYSCNGTYAALSYTQTTAEMVARTAFTGPSTPDELVKDSEGNQIYDPVTTGVVNYDKVFCESASWKGTTRWAQNVTEEQTVTITAPQSISQYGTIEREQTFGQDDSYDTSVWENYTAYSDNSPDTSASYYLDQDYNSAAFNTAFQVALQRAKMQILDSHRDTRVIITVPFRPDINLSHTVATTATRVSCKGKVQRYVHLFNNSTTEALTRIEIVLSRASGSTTDQTLAIPARLNTASETYPTGTISLGNHYGEDPSQAGAENWTGFIGNKVVQGVKTNYTQSFIVDVPPVPNNLRSNKTLAGTTSYTIEVPNDSLTVTFQGRSLA